MSISDFERTLNGWGQEKVPFLFIVDFEMQKPIAMTLDEAAQTGILYDINGKTNAVSVGDRKYACGLRINPVPFSDYRLKFDFISKHLGIGNSYLANLTLRTEIETTQDLPDIFFTAKARYKLYFPGAFLVFSPEIFIQIREGSIYSYPMKGTIDASVPDAAEMILKDVKEMAEHVTIVDLIRNDLSQIADNVEVRRFRYLDRIETSSKVLYQVSSEIVGELNAGMERRFGTILVRLLPAGSVTGAPKPMTLKLIRAAEGMDRGYYTGVFGIYNGESLDSGVMIRFIEKENDKLYYRSGGGLTTQSQCDKEYQEVLDKIYVPLT